MKRAKLRFFGVGKPRNQARNAAKKQRREKNGYVFFKNRKVKKNIIFLKI